MTIKDRFKVKSIQLMDKRTNKKLNASVLKECRVVYIKTEFGRVKTFWYGDSNSIEPLFIDLHGGGFILGSPEGDHRMNKYFCEKAKCKVVSIEYAKAPQHPYPYAQKQVIAVIKEIIKDKETYRIDPERLAIGGHSAGANLATTICLQAAVTGLKFKCQILDYPPLDLATSPYEKPSPQGCIPPEVAAMFNQCYISPAQAKEKYASPIFCAIDDLRGSPAALLSLAGKDSLFEEGRQYAKMLKEAGVDVSSIEYKDALHGFTMGDSADANDAIEKMTGFLIKHLQA